MQINFPKWFYPSYYKYLFSKPLGDNTFQRIVCRIKGHPNGVKWYNMNGYEPDYHCIDCDEDLY